MKERLKCTLVFERAYQHRRGKQEQKRQRQRQRQRQQWSPWSPAASSLLPFVVSSTFTLLLCAHNINALALPMWNGLSGREGSTMTNTHASSRRTKVKTTLSCTSNNPGRDTLEDLEPLHPPLLELITPDGCAISSPSNIASLIQTIQSAAAGGVSLVQLRDYTSDADSKGDLAVHLAAALGGRAMFVVNGDPDVARASGADGVHLPERMMDCLEDLRGETGWPRLVGCSVHSVSAAVKAARLGADYIQVGTMFTTQSHPGKEPEGLGMLNDVRRKLQDEGLDNVLVIGVGGIDASNCGDVIAAGGDGVAAIRCLCSSSDAEGEARGMMHRMRTTGSS